MIRLIDLIVGINAIIGISAYLGTKIRKRRRSQNIEHTKQLLEENEEIDSMIEEMDQKKGKFG